MLGAHGVRHLLSAEQAGWLDDGALGVDPFGLHRVEPGTLDRQVAHQDAHAMARHTWMHGRHELLGRDEDDA